MQKRYLNKRQARSLYGLLAISKSEDKDTNALLSFLIIAFIGLAIFTDFHSLDVQGDVLFWAYASCFLAMPLYVPRTRVCAAQGNYQPLFEFTVNNINFNRAVVRCSFNQFCAG